MNISLIPYAYHRHVEPITNKLGRANALQTLAMGLQWIIWSCLGPTLYQGLLITLPMLASSLLLRLCVTSGVFHRTVMNTLAALLGLYILWWFYDTGVTYFVVLCVLVYLLLLVMRGHRGVLVGAVSVLFLLVW